MTYQTEIVFGYEYDFLGVVVVLCLSPTLCKTIYLVSTFISAPEKIMQLFAVAHFY